VDDAGAVCSLEAARHLNGDRKRVFHRQRSRRKPLRQGLAVDALHHEGRRAFDFLEAVDRGDVGVIERGEEPGLAAEACESLRIAGEVHWQHLDRHVAVESHVPGPIDLTHPARAERREDLVGAVLRAGNERHGRAARRS
jgi:hypothetical protein